jgi:adenosylhomocysteine nucleosidase
MRLLILAALPSELDGSRAPPGARLIFTGLGKLKSAVSATEAIIEERPDLVVNYGSAGGIKKGLEGLVEIASVVQRDITTEPIAPRGVTPFCPDPPVLKSGHGAHVCGTGDSFVTTFDPWLADNGVDLVDMELFAIAHVCTRFGVPWRAFKFITDDADEQAADHWNENVARGENAFWEALGRL